MKRTYPIDDITWNDLAMEQVYEKINTARSSVGAEYLKQILKQPVTGEEVLQKRSERAAYFTASEQKRQKFQKIFQDLGKTKKLSLYEYIFRFQEIKPAGNGLHYVLILLLLAAIVMIFIQPVIGIIALVVMFVINISTYFKFKAGIESYFMCFKYIVRMLRAASRVCKETPADVPALQELAEELTQVEKDLAPLKRGSWLLTNSVSGSLVDVIMDYVRMLFHVDIIRFNIMRKLAVEKTESIDRLFCTLGEVEAAICISVYRDSLDHWCRPQFQPFDSRTISLHATGMYHPLTSKIVTNDIDVRRSVLLTGSNASGKSTFLKQVAINQILAQTIDTCLAGVYETRFFRVLSSMALTDNILGNESYFIVEIKSLKRILDAAQNAEDVPVLCFIDEVLRGTNTKERVAASSQILKQLSHMQALCFAATHDIELTVLLKEDMDNYHFEESVQGNDVTFDYKIHPGPATSRNAIRLMQAYGFPASITSAANTLVDRL